MPVKSGAKAPLASAPVRTNDVKSITEIRRAQGLKVTIAQQMFNSYGAMNEILDFFEPLDVLKF